MISAKSLHNWISKQLETFPGKQSSVSFKGAKFERVLLKL